MEATTKFMQKKNPERKVESNKYFLVQVNFGLKWNASYKVY